MVSIRDVCEQGGKDTPLKAGLPQYRRLLAVLFLSLFWGLPVRAESPLSRIQPLPTTNFNPFVLIAGIPSMGDSRFAGQGNGFALKYEVASHFVSTRVGDESLGMDGETTRFTVQYHHALNRQTMLEVDLPYIRHDGGQFDHFIEQWHSVFGLPQGGRLRREQDAFHYLYDNKANGEELHFLEAAEGVGDVMLRMGYRFDSTGDKQHALKLFIKFPTGEGRRLTGNGAYTLGAWYYLEDMYRLWGYPAKIYGAGGAAYLREGVVLSGLQKQYAVFGGVGSGLLLHPRFYLQLQLDSHSAIYQDTRLDPLRKPPLMLTMGGAWEFLPRWRLEAGVVEDLNVDVSPDVIFQLRLAYQ